VPLNQQQYDALASYVYNTGSLQGTRMLENLNKGDYAGAVKEMDIVKADGKVQPGLVDRRQKEHNIWNKAEYSIRPIFHRPSSNVNRNAR